MSPPQHFMEQLDQEKRYPAATQDQEITDETTNFKDGYDKEAQTVVTTLDDSSVNSSRDPANTLPPVPLQMKLLSVLLVSCIGFGSQWSSGVSSAMKSTMKKEMHINNTQFSLLEASEDFMSSALILLTGIFTDRLGGTGCIVYGNIIYTIGSILIAGAAETRSYKFMIVGRVIASFGDIATQVAQYKVFSSWFPPSHGFASTLGFELGIKKIGGFVGKSTANIIAKASFSHNCGFSSVFWTMVGMNIFTNLATILLFFLVRFCEKRYTSIADPATGEKLTEKNKKVDFKKVLEMPWPFWCMIAFTIFQTTTANVFSQNATELAEQRFNADSITAGWYTAVLQYAGFFFVPLLGVFIDIFGQRVSAMVVCGAGCFLSMALVCWAPSIKGTAAAFGIYAFAFSLGPTVIIDGIRTSMWHQGAFGTAYGIKVTINNAMSCIIRILTGVIQDADNNSYHRVVRVYAFFGCASLVVSLAILTLSFLSPDLGRLQWSRKKRVAMGAFIQERLQRFETVTKQRNKRISVACFGFTMLVMLGGWTAYFWGVATGNNK
ncbi:major facilitator superfamily transporter [Aureobasidium pullulans]|uniref:Lysosomal dipeptide transporter MFSD1 n=1 Tax=Aureobasidium pullulans TaxID=5580 RepID=A0A4S9J8W7_AURPU|nr:major facilitator superfamily transporter [Aureobasidium pullulans]THX97259.1 major facilitator superfamily transporter [Aureobasidium pullulans]